MWTDAYVRMWTMTERWPNGSSHMSTNMAGKIGSAIVQLWFGHEQIILVQVWFGRRSVPAGLGHSLFCLLPPMEGPPHWKKNPWNCLWMASVLKHIWQKIHWKTYGWHHQYICNSNVFDTLQRHSIFDFPGWYTVYSKRNAHLILKFLVTPLGKGGQIFTWSIMYLHNLLSQFLSPFPQGGHQKIQNLMCVSFGIDCIQTWPFSAVFYRVWRDKVSLEFHSLPYRGVRQKLEQPIDVWILWKPCILTKNVNPCIGFWGN